MSYRPITDVWILARPKVKFYGAYPAGFLSRARALLGVRPSDAVLHICAGAVRQYPGPHAGITYKGLGQNDLTLDASARFEPDFLRDANLDVPPLHVRGREAREVIDEVKAGGEVAPYASTFKRTAAYGATTDLKPIMGGLWPAVLIDRPYTEHDHAQYEVAVRGIKLPSVNLLLRHGLRAVPHGCKVGILDYVWPRPPHTGALEAIEVAVVSVLMGRGNQARVFTVFERL